MKKSLLIIMTLALVASDVWCSGSRQNTTAKNAETITVTDQAGYTVTVPKHIERIAVCGIFPLPSVLAVFFDSAAKIVGMPPTSMNAAKNSLLSVIYPDILKANTGYTKASSVNVEELMKLDPQVVFYGASSTQMGDELRKAGFNAVAISVNKWHYNSIETLDNWIELLSQIFPDNDKAALVKKYSDDIYTMIQQRTAGLSDAQRQRVFFLFHYNDSVIMTSGKNFFGEYWAEAIGAKNVGEEMTKDNSIAVNLEQVYKWNPQTIFITNFTPAQPADLYDNRIGSYDWSGIDAVKNHRVFKMPLGMYRSYTPGIDTPVTLLWLAKAAYPDLFKDIDITQKTIEYYKTVFGVTLTKEQADSIFKPTAAAGVTNF